MGYAIKTENLVKRYKAKSSVERTIKAFGLEEFSGKKAKLLSGGYKRKLSMDQSNK